METPSYPAVYERVQAIVTEVLGVDGAEISPESSLVGDLGADSLDLVTLMVAFERAFSATISTKDAAELATVKDIVNYIVARQHGERCDA